MCYNGCIQDQRRKKTFDLIWRENGTASVECDNVEGGKLAAAHLIDKGCKNLLLISGVSETAMPADDRATGFVQVCEEKGVLHTEVDGIFASSDLIAAQILQVCAKLGKKIPEDIKLVGFDDVNIASLTTPTISTIHQPIKEMAEAAIDLLIHAAQGKTVAKRTLLPVSFVERDSTAAR